MWHKFLYCTLVPMISSMAFVTGQCTNYELQSNQYKRSSSYQLTGTDVAISDNFLSEGWYRFQSGAGNDMVTSAPSIAMCGTLYPVWLDGSLPLQGEGTVDRTACVVGLTRSCESTISIKIRNCGTYNVYYLRKTPILASGYCFGEQVRCPDGQGSENGFTPGCQMLPAITVSPVVDADLEDIPSQNSALGSTMKSYFECTFNKPSMGPYYFDITWYINEDEVRRMTNVVYEDIASTRLLPEHWVHQYNLNMVVRCSVRVHTSSGGTPSNEMSSRDYQAGIFPESFIYHLDEGQTMSIPFQVTYPVGCLFTNLESNCKTVIYMLTPYYQSSVVDTCQNIQSTEAVLFKENKCGIVISSNTWRESKVLNVTGNIDNLINERDREIYIRLGNNGPGGDPFRAWDNVIMPDIKVYISDVDNTISNRICKLQTDPRFWTFDNKRHDIYTAGEFVLYRHKKRNVEVHALFTACSGDSDDLGAACTCGVAIRVEDSLYVYRTCDEVSYQTVSLLAHHSTIYEICDDKHMIITTEYDYTVITLPSGTTVKYNVYSNWIQHLQIIPSVFDIGNLEGICGDANGNDSDDFVAPDGRTPASERREDIDSIINTWKIDPASPNSLFGSNPSLENTDHDVQKYCSCATESPNSNLLQNLPDHHAAVCNITTSLVGCSQQQTTASFLTTCNRFANNGRKRRDLSENGYSERRKRVRRSAHDSDDVIDFEPLKYDPAYSFSYIPQIPTWRNGWNESHAIQVCEDSINNDPVKLECEKHIDIRQMVNDSISSCILDIRDSASTEWVAGTIDAIKSYCLTRISKYEKFYVSNSSEEKSVVEVFNAVTCINNCSKHGHCTDKGMCLCDTGFIGADCSHSIHKPPENIVLPEEGLCRQSIRPCAKTNIVGNFLSGTTIYVKLQQYKISTLGKGTVINTERTTAQYRAPNLISVVLPSSTRRRKRSVSSELGLGFDISLSYDNTHFGEELKFIIYDDSCYNCNSTTTTCTILDSCSYSTTESTTMSPGASPSYTGSSHTTLTHTTTTMSDGESSSPVSPNDQDNTKMILIIVSALLAVALIVVAVVLFLKCKNKSIKQSNPLYYNTEPVKNGCPPMNTYEDMYSRPFSPPPPYQDNRKTGRPSSSSSIRATFDETKSNRSFNFDIFSVDSQRKNF